MILFSIFQVLQFLSIEMPTCAENLKSYCMNFIAFSWKVGINYITLFSFIQCWSYFHLNIGRPDLKQDLSHRFPLALHWKGRLNNQTKSDVVVYRQKLDSLESIDVSSLNFFLPDVF